MRTLYGINRNFRLAIRAFLGGGLGLFLRLFVQTLGKLIDTSDNNENHQRHNEEIYNGGNKFAKAD